MPALRGLLSVWMILAYNCNIMCKPWRQRWMQCLRHFSRIKRLWMSNWPIIDKSRIHSPPFPHHLYPKAMYKTKTMSKLSLEEHTRRKLKMKMNSLIFLDSLSFIFIFGCKFYVLLFWGEFFFFCWLDIFTLFFMYYVMLILGSLC